MSGSAHERAAIEPATPPPGEADTAAVVDPSLQQALDGLAPTGVLIGCRPIAPGDEDALLEIEAASIASPVVAVRRASGAARIVARQLMEQLGYAPCPLPKGEAGAPIWPKGIVGSLAHDDRIAVAAIGMQRGISAVGVDIEPAVRLSQDMLELIVTPQELSRMADDPLAGRLHFAIKEAVYKAVYPLDRVFLEFCDIEVDLAGRRATTRTGRLVTFRYCISSHVVVLASV